MSTPQTHEQQISALVLELANAYKTSASRSDSIINLMAERNQIVEQFNATKKELEATRKAFLDLKAKIGDAPVSALDEKDNV